MAKQRQAGTAATESWFDRLSPVRQDALLIGLMYVLLLLLFNEIIFKDLVFSSGADTAAAEAWNRAITHISETEHVEPLWIPYIFGGMPLFGSMILPRQVDYFYSGILVPVSKVLFFNAQMHWMILPFLMMGIGMFYLARHFRFSKGASFLAAVTMMLNPYAVGLPETGHGSKLIVLSIIPWLLFAVVKLFEHRSLLWCGILALITGTLLLNRHPQIAFYGLMAIGLYFVYELVLDIRQQPGAIPKKAILFVLALGIGFGMYAYHYFPVNEYAEYSIRGSGGVAGGSGLDYSYATNWSFHPFEMLNYINPSFFGLSFFGDKIDQYWGWMPFTNSTVTVGVVPLFLGILGLSYKRTRFVWYLIVLAVLMLFMSFGKHLPVIFNLMFNFVPHFKQFRTPVMVLHLMPVVFGILAASGYTFLSELLGRKEGDAAVLRKRLTVVLAVIAGLFLLGLVLNGVAESILSGFLFQKEGESSRAAEQLRTVRFQIFWQGYIWVSVIGCAAIGLVIAALRRKVAPSVLTAGLVALTILDLWVLDQKYINPQPASTVTEHFRSDATIAQLQAQSEKEVFRVFPAGQMDGENFMMYHHLQSVEGYCPAKLKIYQDVRDSCFSRGTMAAFNMLNVRYLVGQQEGQDGSVHTVVQANPGALPRAWFVDSTILTASMAQTFSILNSPGFNPATTAIVEKSVPVRPGHTGAGPVQIVKYSSREIVLHAETPREALMVLSEIYYPAGWTAAIDGRETEIYKTNHILRSVVVPAGGHEIVFRFDPPAYAKGFAMTNISWGLTALLMAAGGVMTYAARRKKNGSGGEAGTPA